MSSILSSLVGNLIKLRKYISNGFKNVRQSDPLTLYCGCVWIVSFVDRTEYLQLTGGGFRGTIPSELGRLSYLSRVYLDYNFDLTGTLPSSLGNLSNLGKLVPTVFLCKTNYSYCLFLCSCLQKCCSLNELVSPETCHRRFATFACHHCRIFGRIVATIRLSKTILCFSATIPPVARLVTSDTFKGASIITLPFSRFLEI